MVNRYAKKLDGLNHQEKAKRQRGIDQASSLVVNRPVVYTGNRRMDGLIVWSKKNNKQLPLNKPQNGKVSEEARQIKKDRPKIQNENLPKAVTKKKEISTPKRRNSLIDELNKVKAETEKMQNQFESGKLDFFNQEQVKTISSSIKTNQKTEEKNSKSPNFSRQKQKSAESEFLLIKKFFASIRELFCYAVKLAAVLFVAYLSFYFTVFIFKLDQPAIRKVASVVTLPYFFSTRGFVSYFDYSDTKNYLGQNAKQDDVLRQLVKRQLLKEIILEDLSKKNFVVADQRELADRYYNLTKELKSNEEKKQLLGYYYSLGEQRYVDRVIKWEVLSEKLEPKLILDRQVNVSAQARIEKIKEMATNQDFDQLAKKYGDEYNAGEYLVVADAVNKFGDSVLELEPKQTSDPIASSDGYYLLQCYDRADNLIGLKHVFIKAITLDEYLEKEIIKSNSWFVF